MAGKNRWFQLSLRAFLILFTCVAIVVATFSRYAQQRKAAFQAIRAAGGDIEMSIAEASMLEQWFGADVFGSVAKVDLRSGKADNELLEHLAVLKELRQLDLSNANIDDRGLRLIEHLPLREVWLQSTKITDASAASLSKMKTLDFLQLNATDVSDAFLDQLQPLPALQNLGLRGTRVTGAGMKHLARHPNLQKLDVYSTEVDDSGVEHLVGCQSLTNLGLSMTKITNRVFEHLDRLPNLTNADLSGNDSISTKAVLDFEKTHPSCDIEWYAK